MLFQDKVYEKLQLFVVALILVGVELFIPRIPLMPWLKMGLVNIVTLTWIIRFGYRDALLFSLLRIWLTSFFFGFSFFTSSLALSGTLLAISGMAIAIKISERVPLFGYVGVGIIGAFFHNVGQLGMLNFLVGEASLSSIQLPIMSAISIVTGGCTGWLASLFNRLSIESGNVVSDEIEVAPLSLTKKVISLLLLVIMIGMVWVDTIYGTLAFATIAFLISLGITRSFKKSIQGVTKLWLLILALFITAFITSGGDWIHSFTHIFRVWGWLQCTLIFRFLESDKAIFALLKRVFKTHDSTLASAILAVEVFPELINGKHLKTIKMRNLIRPTSFLRDIIELSHSILEGGGWGERKSDTSL